MHCIVFFSYFILQSNVSYIQHWRGVCVSQELHEVLHIFTFVVVLKCTSRCVKLNSRLISKLFDNLNTGISKFHVDL